MKRTILVAGLVGLQTLMFACLCPAPVNGYGLDVGPVAKESPSSSHTSNNLKKQRVLPAMGNTDTLLPPQMDANQFRKNTTVADSALQVASNTIIEKQDASTPKGFLLTGVKSIGRNWSSILEAVVFIVVGVATVFGIRRWADKNVPDVPASYSNKNSW